MHAAASRARSAVRVASLVAPGRIELREEPDPIPEPGGIVLRVRVALTDGTDLKAFRRGHPQMPMPTRFGHEFSGEVVALGAGTRGWNVGEPVMAVHSAPDFTCFWCRRAQEELCETVMSSKILGAYGELLALPARILACNAYRKPDGLSFEAAAFLEPLACVVHAQEAAQFRSGDELAIVGDGGFGLLHALLARAGGARPILVGRHPERLALAQSLGVERTVLAAHPGCDANAACSEAIREATGGRGADMAIECTGRAEVWAAIPAAVRRGGTAVLFGGLPAGTAVPFEAARLHYDEVRILSPFHFTPSAVRRAYELLAANVLPVESLIGARVPLAQIWEAFDAMARGVALKVA
ncbi:MAG: zinc-dependent alcohol dehydrogenase, partial [Candidatus Dormibacteria bacterium]